MKTIGDKIKELLELKDMSQGELARQSGLSKSLINMLVNNERTDVLLDTAKRIAKVFGIHPAFFFEEDILSPGEIFMHLTAEEKDFLINSNNLPWIKLSQSAAEKGLSPVQVREVIDIMFKNIK